VLEDPAVSYLIMEKRVLMSCMAAKKDCAVVANLQKLTTVQRATVEDDGGLMKEMKPVTAVRAVTTTRDAYFQALLRVSVLPMCLPPLGRFDSIDPLGRSS
jgi:hypothetical protein